MTTVNTNETNLEVTTTETTGAPATVEREIPEAVKAIITPGKRGVTNAQMIPALVKVLEEGSKEKLELLKEYYPTQYENCTTKYLSKLHREMLNNILNPQPEAAVEDEAVGA